MDELIWSRVLYYIGLISLPPIAIAWFLHIDLLFTLFCVTASIGWGGLTVIVLKDNVGSIL